jgi:hypothetical protein
MISFLRGIPTQETWENSKTYDLSHHCDSHPGLFLHYRCGSAAERPERGHFCCLWRPGQPDRIRSTRRSQRAFESYNLVGGGIHDHIHCTCGVLQQAQRPDVGFAGDQVATSQDAACSSAESGHATGAAEVTFRRSSHLVPSARRAREQRAHRLPTIVYISSSRFPCNCICPAEVVPSGKDTFSGRSLCQIVMGATLLCGSWQGLD